MDRERLIQTLQRQGLSHDVVGQPNGVVIIYVRDECLGRFEFGANGELVNLRIRKE